MINGHMDLSIERFLITKWYCECTDGNGENYVLLADRKRKAYGWRTEHDNDQWIFVSKTLLGIIFSAEPEHKMKGDYEFWKLFIYQL